MKIARFAGPDDVELHLKHALPDTLDTPRSAAIKPPQVPPLAPRRTPLVRSGREYPLGLSEREHGIVRSDRIRVYSLRYRQLV